MDFWHHKGDFLAGCKGSQRKIYIAQAAKEVTDSGQQFFYKYYEFFGSSRIVVELSEADQDPLLKIDKIPKSVTHAFHCLDRIVNTFNDARGHPMREVV